MVTTHLWPGATAILDADLPPLQRVFFHTVINYMGRCSVPLLSVISGVLLFASLSRGDDPGALILRKARSLLQPMVIWSALLLGLMLGASLAGIPVARLPAAPLDWVNALFALSAPPINIPLAFLRDVFVCAVLAILLFVVAGGKGWLACLFLLVIAMIEVTFDGVFLLRPQILVFFLTGLALAAAGKTDVRPPLSLLAFLLAIQIFVAEVWRPGFATGWAFSYYTRMVVSLAMWSLARAVADRRGWLWRLCTRLEPHVFFIFCAHMIFVALLGWPLRRLGVSVDDPVYLAAFLMQWSVIAVGGYRLSVLLQDRFPRLNAILMGSSPRRRAKSSSRGITKENA